MPRAQSTFDPECRDNLGRHVPLPSCHIGPDTEYAALDNNFHRKGPGLDGDMPQGEQMGTQNGYHLLVRSLKCVCQVDWMVVCNVVSLLLRKVIETKDRDAKKDFLHFKTFTEKKADT